MDLIELRAGPLTDLHRAGEWITVETLARQGPVIVAIHDSLFGELLAGMAVSEAEWGAAVAAAEAEAARPQDADLAAAIAEAAAIVPPRGLTHDERLYLMSAWDKVPIRKDGGKRLANSEAGQRVAYLMAALVGHGVQPQEIARILRLDLYRVRKAIGRVT